MAKRGLIVVISAPSGGGKTAILRNVFARGDENFRYSVSVTTRPRRRGELDGHDYFFLSREEFLARRERGEFVEWAEVHGYFYATPKAQLSGWLQQGCIVFCDLDVDGGISVKKEYGDSALLIFVKPPSFESLMQRLKLRNTETDEEIAKRMQRYPKEMSKAEFYDYQVVNENLANTTQEILELVLGAYKAT